MLQLISTQIPGQTSSSHLNGNLLPSTCLDPVSNQRSRGQSYRDAPSSLPAITLPFNELTTVELRGWIVLNKIKADRSSQRYRDTARISRRWGTIGEKFSICREEISTQNRVITWVV